MIVWIAVGVIILVAVGILLVMFRRKKPKEQRPNPSDHPMGGASP